MIIGTNEPSVKGKIEPIPVKAGNLLMALRKKLNERRINLRFDDETFRRLGVKSASEGASFQELGEAWFREWLAGERAAPHPDIGPVSEEEAEFCRGFLNYMRNAPADEADEYLVNTAKRIAKKWRSTPRI